MTSLRPRICILIALTLLVAIPSLAEDGATPILDRVLEAYGGSSARERAATVRQTGVVSATMRNGHGEIVRTFERPGKLRVEIKYEGMPDPEIRVLDGSQGWRSGDPVQGPMLTSMILQAARMGLPWILADHADAIVDRGTVERDGGERRVLELPLDDSTSIIVEIDPETARITRSIGRASAPGFPGGVMEFATDYDDFRMIDGLLVPFHEKNYAMGHSTGETHLTQVKVGVEIPPSTFAP